MLRTPPDRRCVHGLMRVAAAAAADYEQGLTVDTAVLARLKEVPINHVKTTI